MPDDVRVGLVRVDQVRFHPHNVRRDLGDLRPLADSISAFGVMQPIVVERMGDHLRLRAGHRRVAAAKLIKLARIPAVIHDEVLDDENWLVHSIQENVMRRGIDADERRDAILALADLGCTWAGIGEVFGVHPNTIRIWAGVAERSDSVKTTSKGRPVKVSTLRSFVSAWRGQQVDADAILDALDRLSESSRLSESLPQSGAS